VPSSDHTYNGYDFSATAGENVAMGDVCYLKSDGKFWKCDADAEATTKGMLVMASTAITANNAGIFLMPGAFIRDDTWNFTIGAELYVSPTAGNPTAIRPSTANQYVRIVGHAYTADVIFFNPDQTYIKI
jgi:hypothetical protein